VNLLEYKSQIEKAANSAEKLIISSANLLSLLDPSVGGLEKLEEEIQNPAHKIREYVEDYHQGISEGLNRRKQKKAPIRYVTRALKSYKEAWLNDIQKIVKGYKEGIDTVIERIEASDGLFKEATRELKELFDVKLTEYDIEEGMGYYGLFYNFKLGDNTIDLYLKMENFHSPNSATISYAEIRRFEGDKEEGYYLSADKDEFESVATNEKIEVIALKLAYLFNDSYIASLTKKLRKRKRRK
jgi:soluble cytochrome b562